MPSACELAVQLGEDGLHLHAGVHGAFGVVLVRAGDAEHGQDRVAHELLEQALVPGDLLGQAVERSPHDGLHYLGVFVLGERGRAHQVGEQRGGELALLPAGLGGLERFAASQAEPSSLRVLLTAPGTGTHGRSLGHRCANATGGAGFGGSG